MQRTEKAGSSGVFRANPRAPGGEVGWTAGAPLKGFALNRGNSQMATIAAEIGYESEASFSRAFKKMMGVPPSAWRQGAR